MGRSSVGKVGKVPIYSGIVGTLLGVGTYLTYLGR